MIKKTIPPHVYSTPSKGWPMKYKKYQSIPLEFMIQFNYKI